MAYDAICSFPAGVTVTRDTVSPVFGAPFGRLTATVDGDVIAITTRFWDIAEVLNDLLGYVTTALADDVTAVIDGDMVDRYDDDDDNDAGALFVDGVFVARVTHVTI
jgi:hypothetical protein